MRLTYDVLLHPPAGAPDAIDIPALENALRELNCYDGNSDHVYAYQPPGAEWTADLFLNLAGEEDERQEDDLFKRDSLALCIPMGEETGPAEPCFNVATAIAARMGFTITDAQTRAPISIHDRGVFLEAFARARELAAQWLRMNRAVESGSAECAYALEWLDGESTMDPPNRVHEAGQAIDADFSTLVEATPLEILSETDSDRMYVRLAVVGNVAVFEAALKSVMLEDGRAVLKQVGDGYVREDRDGRTHLSDDHITDIIAVEEDGETTARSPW